MIGVVLNKSGSDMDRLLFMPVNINQALIKVIGINYIKRNYQNNDLICGFSRKKPEVNPAKYLRVIIRIKLIQEQASLLVVPVPYAFYSRRRESQSYSCTFYYSWHANGLRCWMRNRYQLGSSAMR